MNIVNLPISLRELSHELRTPLTGILGMAEILSQEKLTPKQQAYLNDIQTAGDCLLKTINQLLSESKKLNSTHQKNEESKLTLNKGLRYG